MNLNFEIIFSVYTVRLVTCVFVQHLRIIAFTTIYPSKATDLLGWIWSYDKESRAHLFDIYLANSAARDIDLLKDRVYSAIS